MFEVRISPNFLNSGQYFQNKSFLHAFNVASTTCFLSFQSAIDLTCSLTLLLITHTVKDAYQTTTKGLLGDLECSVWNSRLFLWGTLVSSSWNLVCLTIERCLMLSHLAFFSRMKYTNYNCDKNMMTCSLYICIFYISLDFWS